MASINTNVKALAAQSSMSNVDRSLQTSMQRLSTGLRINNAKDDAAGLAISNRMTSDIRGFAVAIRNANDGLSMAQTADGALGQVTDMLQRMRELAVQAGNGSLNADNRIASQLEVDQLKQQIDNIATQTNFNSINLLDGTAGNIKLQTNVRANQQMTMSIDSAQTKDIGLGSRASLTSTGFYGATAGSLAKQMAAGDLVINGQIVGASNASDDLLSISDKSSSAIAKVAAINLISSSTGVTASVGNTTVGGNLMTQTGALAGTIVINGVATSTITSTTVAGDNRALVVAAINAKTAQSGVRAIDTGDLNKGVVLVADDGRNIKVAVTGTLTEAESGIGTSGIYTGTYQLSSSNGSPISISTTSNGVLSNSGLSAGTYNANVSVMTTVDRAVGATTVAPGTGAGNTGLLQAGTLRINGTSIVASTSADDTASDVSATSSTKSASAIAIAAAINKASSTTGVTATAAPNVIVGTTFTSATKADSFFLNGVTITLNTTAGVSTRGDVATLINSYTGQTGVVATDNGQGLTLTAADGRNISMAAATASAANLGVSSAAFGGTTALAAVTTYSRVTLQSDKSFTVEGGSDGNANFALLGFKTGTFGGVDNGVKVSKIDITSQAGAQVAITALDAALKSVSLNQARLGAFQNRLDQVVSNLTTMNQNMSASRSRVQDADYATETTNLAKSQIISQAATAMLAQANQSSQSVLALLK